MLLIFLDYFGSNGFSIQLLQCTTDFFSKVSADQWKIIWSEAVLLNSFGYSQQGIKSFYQNEIEVPELYRHVTSTGIAKSTDLLSREANLRIMYQPIFVENSLVCVLQGMGDQEENLNSNWYFTTMTKICQHLSNSAPSLLVNIDYISSFRKMPEKFISNTASISDLYSTLSDVLDNSRAALSMPNLGMIYATNDEKCEIYCSVDSSPNSRY